MCSPCLGHPKPLGPTEVNPPRRPETGWKYDMAIKKIRSARPECQENTGGVGLAACGLSGSARAAGEAGDGGDQLCRLDGLGDVGLVAAQDRLGAVLGAGVGGERDGGDV